MGSCFIVGSSPTGDWVGNAQYLAAFTSGGWRLLSPVEGMALRVKTDGQWVSYWAGAWELGTIRGASVIIDGKQVLGSQAAAIAAPTAGSIIDAEARAAISQLLVAVRQHGLIAGE
jgi:hypothetical protein